MYSGEINFNGSAKLREIRLTNKKEHGLLLARLLNKRLGGERTPKDDYVLVYSLENDTIQTSTLSIMQHLVTQSQSGVAGIPVVELLTDEQKSYVLKTKSDTRLIIAVGKNHALVYRQGWCTPKPEWDEKLEKVSPEGVVCFMKMLYDKMPESNVVMLNGGPDDSKSVTGNLLCEKHTRRVTIRRATWFDTSMGVVVQIVKIRTFTRSR